MYDNGSNMIVGPACIEKVPSYIAEMGRLFVVAVVGYYS